MAIAKPISLLKSISGKLNKKEDQVFYVKFGKNFVWTNRGVHSFNATQLANQTILAQAAATVSTLLANPTQRATYEAAFKAQDKYLTLQGFIMADQIAQIKAAAED
ncbi:MAG: hypothetical protein MJ002_05620 [Paludibacteraceae bacterium]|nr:hypothetical protein [Paludibacteraceae bacterium]